MQSFWKIWLLQYGEEQRKSIKEKEKWAMYTGGLGLRQQIKKTNGKYSKIAQSWPSIILLQTARILLLYVWLSSKI